MLCGGLFLAAYAFPLFWLLDTKQVGAATIGIVVGYAGAAAIYAPMAVFFAELFHARVRYSGAAVSFQVGSALGGGLAPLVAIALLSVDGGRSWPVALYLVVGALVGIGCLLTLGEPSARRVTTPNES